VGQALAKSRNVQTGPPREFLRAGCWVVIRGVVLA
jgi:hypothetical protein